MNNSQQEALAIASRTTYLNKEIIYIKNTEICEWDIKSAGLSVIKFNKLLSEEEINNLEKMEKSKRTVAEGLLQRDNPKIAESIINTLKKAVQGFVIMNNIQPENILSIKKDAVFVIKTKITNPIIKEYFVFREKSKYTTYLRLGKIEFYYNSLTDVLDIKGISKENIELQKDFLLKDIKRLLKVSEKIDSTSLYELLKSYRSKYLNRELPIETYRELESGYFRIGNYLMERPDGTVLDSLDISQNYMNFLMPMFEALL